MLLPCHTLQSLTNTSVERKTKLEVSYEKIPEYPARYGHGAFARGLRQQDYPRHTRHPDTPDKQEETIHIGIVTGSVSQSEDDRRGAEAFQQLYGEENVTLVTYPDNFTEELETTIQCISSKITSTISVQLMPLYKSPHITKGLSSAAVLTGCGGNVTISTSKSLGEKNR